MSWQLVYTIIAIDPKNHDTFSTCISTHVYFPSSNIHCGLKTSVKRKQYYNKLIRHILVCHTSSVLLCKQKTSYT